MSIINNDYNLYGQNQFDDDDFDEFLESASIELLEDSIVKQLEDPYRLRKQNYIETFYVSYRKTKARLMDMDDDALPTSELEDLEVAAERFLAAVTTAYYDALGIGIPNFSNMSAEDQEEMLDMIYRYFIKDMKKNFISVAKDYIEKCEGLADQYEEKVDVTTAAFKDVLTTDDIKIISNLDEIVDRAFSVDYTVDEFINATLNKNDSAEALFIKEAYENNELTGNFVSRYIGYTSEFYSNIVSKLRQYIFDKYPDSPDDIENI